MELEILRGEDEEKSFEVTLVTCTGTGPPA
jgi:hypothetical protein